MQRFAKTFLTLDLHSLDKRAHDLPADCEAERNLFAADGLRASGRLRLRVRGESMLPSLWPGEVVEIESSGVDGARHGDIVLALRDGRFFLHRFVRRTESGGFLLQGDSMPSLDPEYQSEAMVGRVVAGNGGAGFSYQRTGSRVVGRALARWEPARRLALWLHAQWRERPEEEKSQVDRMPARQPLPQMNSELPDARA